MTKPTKKRIDEVAKKLLVNWLPGAQESLAGAWKRACEWDKRNWRQLAKFVLTELQPDPHAITAHQMLAQAQRLVRTVRDGRSSAMRRGFEKVHGRKAKPKSCKLVRGKVVCK